MCLDLALRYQLLHQFEKPGGKVFISFACGKFGGPKEKSLPERRVHCNASIGNVFAGKFFDREKTSVFPAAWTQALNRDLGRLAAGDAVKSVMDIFACRRPDVGGNGGRAIVENMVGTKVFEKLMVMG